MIKSSFSNKICWNKKGGQFKEKYQVENSTDRTLKNFKGNFNDCSWRNTKIMPVVAHRRCSLKVYRLRWDGIWSWPKEQGLNWMETHEREDARGTWPCGVDTLMPDKVPDAWLVTQVVLKGKHESQSKWLQEKSAPSKPWTSNHQVLIPSLGLENFPLRMPDPSWQLSSHPACRREKELSAESHKMSDCFHCCRRPQRLRPGHLSLGIWRQSLT